MISMKISLKQRQNYSLRKKNIGFSTDSSLKAVIMKMCLPDGKLVLTENFPVGLVIFTSKL
ncbi:hypothetical protein X975_17612, partial [Stegodyphus mimosarum]